MTMTVLDFPDAPIVGQIFTSESKSWIWSGSTWKSAGGLVPIIGPQGVPGQDGLNGVDGSNGLPGVDGVDGSDGLPGVVVATLPITYDAQTQTVGIDQSKILLSISQITDYVVPENYTSEGVSSDISLVKNVKYFVDTTAVRSLTLPATPELGDEVLIFDASGLAETNHITVLRNGSPINGLLEDAIIDVSQSTSIFTYTGSTIGWRFE